MDATDRTASRRCSTSRRAATASRCSPTRRSRDAAALGAPDRGDRRLGPARAVRRGDVIGDAPAGGLRRGPGHAPSSTRSWACSPTRTSRRPSRRPARSTSWTSSGARRSAPCTRARPSRPGAAVLWLQLGIVELGGRPRSRARAASASSWTAASRSSTIAWFGVAERRIGRGAGPAEARGGPRRAGRGQRPCARHDADRRTPRGGGPARSTRLRASAIAAARRTRPGSGRAPTPATMIPLRACRRSIAMATEAPVGSLRPDAAPPRLVARDVGVLLLERPVAGATAAAPATSRSRRARPRRPAGADAHADSSAQALPERRLDERRVRLAARGLHRPGRRGSRRPAPCRPGSRRPRRVRGQHVVDQRAQRLRVGDLGEAALGDDRGRRAAARDVRGDHLRALARLRRPARTSWRTCASDAASARPTRPAGVRSVVSLRARP